MRTDCTQQIEIPLSFLEKCCHTLPKRQNFLIGAVFARGEGSGETRLLSALEGTEKVGARLFLEVCSDVMSSKRHKPEHGKF